MNAWLKSKFLSTRFEIGTQLGQNPLVFFWWRRLFMPETRHLLVSDKTEIVIEGFPRSGNTFAVTAFTIAQSRPVNIARHTHRAAQVVTAVHKNLPTLIVIRHPLDAVLSLVIRHPYISLQQGFRNYIRFYQDIQPYRNGFVIAKFDDIISDFGQVIIKLNEKFGTSFTRFAHNEQNVERCFRLIEEMNRAYTGQGIVLETAVGRPSLQRKEKMVILKDNLNKDKKLQLILRQAEIYYLDFISLTNLSQVHIASENENP